MANWKQVLTLNRATVDVTYQDLIDAGWIAQGDVPNSLVTGEPDNTITVIGAGTDFIPGKLNDAVGYSDFDLTVTSASTRAGVPFNHTDGFLGTHGVSQLDVLRPIAEQNILTAAAGGPSLGTDLGDPHVNQALGLPIFTNNTVWGYEEVEYFGGAELGISIDLDADGVNDPYWDSNTMYIGDNSSNTTKRLSEFKVYDGTNGGYQGEYAEYNDTHSAPFLVLSPFGDHGSSTIGASAKAYMGAYLNEDNPHITTVMPMKSNYQTYSDGNAIFFGNHDHSQYMPASGGSLGNATMTADGVMDSSNHAGFLIGPDDVIAAVGNTVVWKLNTDALALSTYIDNGSLQALAGFDVVPSNLSYVRLVEDVSTNDNYYQHAGSGATGNYDGGDGFKIVGGKYIVVKDKTDLVEAAGNGATVTADPTVAKFNLRYFSDDTGIADHPGFITNAGLEDTIVEDRLPEHSNLPIAVASSLVTIDDSCSINTLNNLSDDLGISLGSYGDIAMYANSSHLMTGATSGIANVAEADETVTENSFLLKLGYTETPLQVASLEMKFDNGHYYPGDVSMYAAVRNTTSEVETLENDNRLYRARTNIIMPIANVANLAAISSSTAAQLEEEFDAHPSAISNQVEAFSDMINASVDGSAIGNVMEVKAGNGFFEAHHLDATSDAEAVSTVWILTDEDNGGDDGGENDF